jgi:hypothetical protein
MICPRSISGTHVIDRRDVSIAEKAPESTATFFVGSGWESLRLESLRARK